MTMPRDKTANHIRLMAAARQEFAHRMRTVEAADKIVVLKEGRVAEEGSPEKLLAGETSKIGRSHV